MFGLTLEDFLEYQEYIKCREDLEKASHDDYAEEIRMKNK